MIFSDSDPDPDPTFQLVSVLYPDPNIPNINFTFVFPSCKCVRLHFMTRYKLFRELFFLIERNLYFLIEHFC
jgi:hypothetical protein